MGLETCGVAASIILGFLTLDAVSRGPFGALGSVMGCCFAFFALFHLGLACFLTGLAL